MNKRKGMKEQTVIHKTPHRKMQGMNAGATERSTLPASLVVSVVLVITVNGFYIVNDNK
jgi:hypothetical protein